MPGNLKNLAIATELENISFHSNPKERHSQGMFIAVVSYASKVMLKILQTKLQEYVQTTAQLHSSHTLVSNAQNSPSEALVIRES